MEAADLVEAAITGAIAPIAAVGTAVLLVLAVHMTIKSVRASLDHEAEAELFHQEFMDEVRGETEAGEFVDDWTDYDADEHIIADVGFTCFHCDWEAFEDDAINVYENGYCTKCGEDL